ncbi:NADH ubiquinone oxidoreductase [Fervidicella metallireducens AeB]|uniref:NADH ubiquinone oxidoreductase n=1 Tax=Fervidicella metallireducens AeB TaxID=1403537 RepID=A0A017RVH1_9CLOT|nr:NADH-quinone oxidoreductase subunit NuoB [Fervidicella metallireducens]EYE88677.1 NADH ubiquinone oxidoreductase [Fervidicella metallireducens AeB]
MKFLIDRIKNGNETIKDPFYENGYSYGKVTVDMNKCIGCKNCLKQCLVGAITFHEKIEIANKKCIYCRECLNSCEAGAIKMNNDYKLSEIETAGEELKNKIFKRFNRSLILRSVDTGSCNACMLELSATTNTYYSLSRYGINFAASPRHADGLVITGPVTINMKEALIKTYYAMPQPRIVIALGSCAYDGGVFKDGYGNFKSLKDIVPVDLVIPGCPPSPQAIIFGLLKLIDRI